MTDKEILKAYVEGFKTKTEAAKNLGISLVMLNQYESGNRTIGAKTRERMRAKGLFDNAKHSPDVYGTIDPVKPTYTPLMLSPANCGDPKDIFDDIATYIDISKYHNKHTFYIQAQGDSMTSSRISEGDLLLVDTQRTPRNNDIVVAIIDESVTVKRYKENEMLLQPDNQDVEPIKVTSQVRIIGVVLRADRVFI